MTSCGESIDNNGVRSKLLIRTCDASARLSSGVEDPARCALLA
ncbi:hypothetical protein BRPE64_ECDS03030 (plasmid) [Caballeronia insecticola]|uniref:Uncharacterized protein n=1 Tax=Caballeronia insecticola TaxID=758793 RepID=A0A060PRW9_9BURK|nr:hypothetical protein BRPE64_ECDS03030 [Caballeronia insecticola]